MQANLATIILFLALAFIAATVVCIGLLIFFSDIKFIHLKRRIDYLIWGMAGGILITGILVTMQCTRGGI